MKLNLDKFKYTNSISANNIDYIIAKKKLTKVPISWTFKVSETIIVSL